jgi:hypothetical protein
MKLGRAGVRAFVRRVLDVGARPAQGSIFADVDEVGGTSTNDKREPLPERSGSLEIFILL